MAFQRPLGDLQLGGIRAEDRKKDRQRFEKLSQFLPPTERTEQGVSDYFEQHLQGELDHALGDAQAIWKALKELEDAPGTTLSPKDIDEELRKFVRDAPLVDPESVKQEAAHARIEYVRHWVDAALRGWRLWGHGAGEMDADKHLVPDKPPHDVAAAWKAEHDDAKAYLIRAIALTTDGISEMADSFAKNVETTLVHGNVDLPRGITLTKRNGRTCFVDRD